jgi:hypothetical protein
MHDAGFESVGMRKDGVGFFRMAHVLLNSKIVDTEVEVECGGHADGAKVRGAVATGSNMIHFGEVGDFS